MVLACGTLLGCSAAPDEGDVGDPDASAAEVPDRSGTEILDREWLFVEAAGVPIEADQNAERAASLTLSSEDSRAAGSSGCNRMMGGFTLDGSSIRFEAVAGTRMACPEPQMEVETNVHAALEAARSWEIQGDTLILRGEGAVMARLIPRP